MRAVVVSRAGGPEVLELKTIPTPAPVEGQVLIRVRAFGLNRAELFTRQGDSPSVKFPRVIGIECVGEVVAAPGTALQPGQKVAAMMGGMGREFDGSYAEYTRVPADHVFPLETDLDWAVLGALPEMFQTTNGSLTVGLELQPGETLLIRGGTSSIGRTAAVLAKQLGATVIATSRSEAKAQALLDAPDSPVDHTIVDTGSIASAVRERWPGGVDRVLELVGTATLLDSLKCARPGGVVCMTGILGSSWSLPGFTPMGDIPTGVKLTSYSGGSGDVSLEALQGYVDAVAAGRTPVNLGRTFTLEELPEAHRYMEANKARGKLVVLV